MIVVRSEDGTFLGEVRNLRAAWSPDGEGWRLVSVLRCVTGKTADYIPLAKYKTKEAVIKQIDDMQQCVNNGTATTENMEMYGQPQVSVTTLFVYDLRERKIED
ncbi:MAG TPA: hypothetical protein DCY84_01915 [Firmicutes bacterium]|nr:hypothetical protein [Bacillota bacterium]